MNKKIFTLGCTIPGNAWSNNLSFSTRKALVDADVVLINPEIPHRTYGRYADGYKGLICFSEIGTRNLEKDANHWQEEVLSFWEKGGTVFLFLVKEVGYYLNFSSLKTNYNLLCNWLLCNWNVEIKSSEGCHVNLADNPKFNDFYNKFKDYLYFQAYMKTQKGDVIFVAKDKETILGSFFKTEKGGYLVILPCLNDSFWKNSDPTLGKEFMECLIDIDRQLKGGTEKTKPPKWLVGDEFSTKKARSLEQKIKTNEETMENIQSENEGLQKELDEENIIQGLLFETGKPLEKAVTKALNILGYTVEHYNDGILEVDQIIQSPEGQRFIGECEGKESKDVDIKKLSQLLKNIALDMERKEGAACGILFGNAQKEQEPAARSSGFTQNCKKTAEKQRVALVRTIDLFEVVKYLQDNDDEAYKKECRDAIYKRCESVKGDEIVKFPQPPSSSPQPNGSSTTHKPQ